MPRSGNRLPSSGTPTPVPIAPCAPNWIIILGACFGLITLIGLFAFAYLSANNPRLCTSFQFQLLAGGFALGAALAGGFIGGGAGAQGKSGGTGFSLAFGLTGGAALLLITLAVFSFYAPKGCEVGNSEQMQLDLRNVTAELERTKASLEESRAALASMTAQRDTVNAESAAARAQIKRLVAGIQVLLPDANQLSTSLTSITNLVTQSCSGGQHGTDPLHADQIRSISAGAALRIASAQSAIANIVASVPPDLRK
jgi:hypothetical protein